MGSDSSKNVQPERRESRPQGTTSPMVVPTQHSNINPRPQPPPTLERTRAPYSYTTTDLGNNTSTSSQRLYPDLETQPVRSPVSNVQNQRQNSSSPSGLSSRRDEDYVIFNNYQQRAHVKPSAPPAADVVGLLETSPTFNPPKPAAAPAPPRFGPSNPGPSKATHSATPKAGRPRSVSRCRTADSKFNCPTCTKRFGLTIYNCERGHGSCKECKESQKVCGAEQSCCRAPITGMRNIALEAYVAEIGQSQVAQCYNTNCTLKFNIYDMEKHQNECPFGVMTCPMGTFFGECSHRCKVDDLAYHFDGYHKDQRVAEFDKEMFLFNISSMFMPSDKQKPHKLYFLKNGPYNFLVHVKASAIDNVIYMAVQLLGTAVSSAKWTYEFHVYNKKQPRRKFQYVDTCQSIGTPLNDIFAESKCAILPITYAKSFVCDNLNDSLTYKFYIKKTDTEARPRRRHNNEWKRQNVQN